MSRADPMDPSARSMEEVPRVLVVDDDRMNVEMVFSYLEDEGYTVESAGTGMEALHKVHRQPPDLIFLDAMMPQMNGFEVCARLKKNPETRLIPVVMVTSLSAMDDRVRGIEAGADDFLTKPVRRLELVTRARSLLRSKRYLDDLESAERVILALARAIEQRDGYTEQHTERVADRALELAKRIGLRGQELNVLRQGLMLHDVGKIGIPEAILGKPGKLTDEEFALMMEHPIKGVEICSPLRSRLIAQALPIIRHHHERVDGRGYPDHLAGEEIPLMARLAAVSDAFDAMTSTRPYRPAMSISRALSVLQEGAGTQWDADLIAEFIEMQQEFVRESA